MIKVLVVEDSPTAREMIETILQTSPEIKVIAKVSNGRECINFLNSSQVKPDLITTDIKMPVMDGFELIEHVMAFNPIPILIVTTLQKDANFMKALNLGALDIIEKPRLNEWQQLPKMGIELIEKVKLLSRVKVITHLSGKVKKLQKLNIDVKSENTNNEKIICMASSTGGPNTLLDILKMLPQNFPVPIIIVQHISDNLFITGMLEWFKKSLKKKVELARHGLILEKGVIYIAPANYHLKVDYNRLLLEDSPPLNNQKPSADIFFASAAKAYGNKCIAVILTGSGSDGALGIKEVSAMGGTVIAQDEESSMIFGMPKAAIATNCVDKILNITDIPKELVLLI
ncbi:MAG: hypothetical protein ACD_79C00494G0002 [uncultured bacterium]|nr:MAG: hypothetical protein ACD_79C00494G0002 [uncultured bacterium]